MKALSPLIIAVVLTGLMSFLPGMIPYEHPKSSIMHQDTPQPTIKITALYDNRSVDENLKTAWGFACLIQTPNDNLLFDTGGDAETLLSNMNQMGVDPKTIDKVLISHIHGDHLGGLEGFLDQNPDVTVYIPASFPGKTGEMIRSKGARCERIAASQSIAKNMWSTGEMEGSTNEQALVLESAKGLVVITGCAHPGIAAMVKAAKDKRKAGSVHLVMGGFHRPPGEVINRFEQMGVMKVAPSHCTGGKMIRKFREVYGEDFIEWGVGKVYVIG